MTRPAGSCATGQGAVTLHEMDLTTDARVLCRLDGRRPAAARGVWEKGQVTVFASPYGIAEEPQCALPARGGEDRRLDTPYPLLAHVRETLAPIFRSQMIFALSGSDEADGLSFVTCRRAPGEYTVDLSPSINLFPDLRLVNNDSNEYDRSMAVIDGVMDKMRVMGSKDLVIGLHRPPETHFPAKEHYASVTQTLRTLARNAAKQGITLHLRQAHPRLISSIDEYRDASLLEGHGSGY